MDNSFMKRALCLSKSAVGYTSSNPAVGAVIVKDGQIIGEGFTKFGGNPHAEIDAISSVKNSNDLIGATLYVTLEPCCHYGATPPCTDAIILSGIKNVVVGMLDPFDKVNGKGFKQLESSGLNVEYITDSVLTHKIALVNQPFLKFVKTGLPYVVLKAGISLDGKIATSLGESKWITSPESRTDAKVLRSKFDCVVVGSGTVDSDDCELAPIECVDEKVLLRVIFDKNLSLSLDKKVFRDSNVFVATTDLASSENKNRFSSAGIPYHSFGADTIDVKKLLIFLSEKFNVRSVLIEGGSSLNSSFFESALEDNSLLDRVIFYISPRLIGGTDSLSVIGGKGVKKLQSTLNFCETDVSKIGSDIKVDGIINFY